MRRHSRAAERRGRRNVAIGIGLLAISAAIIGTTAWFVTSAERDAINAETLCPANGPKAHVVLLVDRTDPLTFIQKQAFLGYLDEFGAGRVGEGELLSVFVVGEDYTRDAGPLFEMCNPGKGEDKSRWTANPERIRRQFETRFLQPMHAVAEQLQSQTAAHESPIMEMLQRVAIEGFRRQAVNGPKRLIVFSDMLQNTPGLSQYRNPPDFDTFKRTPYFAKVRSDLAEVEVELLVLMNAPKLQTLRHIAFWEAFFRECGARVVRVRPVEG